MMLVALWGHLEMWEPEARSSGQAYHCSVLCGALRDQQLIHEGLGLNIEQKLRCDVPNSNPGHQIPYAF
eukprot:SAG31_NODE_367_length_16811_cov_20.811584_13_plen_69_part_00